MVGGVRGWLVGWLGEVAGRSGGEERGKEKPECKGGNVRMRLMVGFLVLNWPRVVILGGIGGAGGAADGCVQDMRREDERFRIWMQVAESGLQRGGSELVTGADVGASAASVVGGTCQRGRYSSPAVLVSMTSPFLRHHTSSCWFR